MSNTNLHTQALENPPLISGEYIPLNWLTEEPPAYEFCITPLAPIGVVTVMNAHGGTGKSLLALKMAVHIVLGLDILDATTNSGKVAYMSLEDSEIVFRDRLYKIAQNMPDEVLPRLKDLNEKLMFINRYGIQTHMASINSGTVIETEILSALIDLLKNNAIKCLIVDTFIRTNSLNENDNAQMGALLVLFEKIAKETECAVVLLHHQPKSGASNEYKSRGASAITDNARSVLNLEKVTTKKEIDKLSEESIRVVAREGRLVRVTHTKHNYSAAHPEQYFEITNDGVPVELFPALSDASSLEQRYTELYTWCQEQWEGKPITKTTIDEHYKEIRPKGSTHGKGMYKRALKEAIDTGYAVETDPPERASKNPKAQYYKLSSLEL